MNILRIYDSSRTKLHQTTISQVNKLTWLHYFVGMDVLQFEVPIEDTAAAYLQRNGWVVNEDDIPFIIKYIYQGQGDNVARVVAYSPHFGFNRRVTRPSQGDAVLAATGSPDAVVKAFIRDAAPATGAKSLGITCLADQPGTAITEQTRRHVLGDRVASILSAANRGEVFKWNSGNITFDTYPGKDRTKGNAEGNTECVFAGRLNNVENETLEVDASAEQTTIYVGGAGEDTDREIFLIGDDKTGWERCEAFIDARDVAAGDTATLEQRALQAIMDATITVKAAAKDNVNLVFGKDYNVGDKVTVQVPYRTYEADGAFFKPVDRLLALQLKVSQATITYENDQMNVDVTFGTTVEQQQTTNSTSSRVSNLEAAGSSAGGGGGGQLPVGSLYFNATDATNPATLLGYGTWEAFGQGKVLIGVQASDTDFDAAGKTGGSKSALIAHVHTIGHGHGNTGTESADHGHTMNFATGYVSNDHTHGFSGTTGQEDTGHLHRASNGAYNVGSGSGSTYQYMTNSGSGGAGNQYTGDIDRVHHHSFSGTTGGVSANHTHQVTGSTAGRSAAHTHAVTDYAGNSGSAGSSANTLPPFVTVYIWKRTA